MTSSKPYDVIVVGGGIIGSSVAYWLAANPDYHPVGTCKIGAADDPMAVVDSDLRVFGIDNLRIADASVMPVITNANTNATSIMIGERAADLLLGNRIEGEMI